MNKTTWEIIYDIALEIFLTAHPDSITRDTKFIEDLGADSLDCVEFVMNMEEDLGLEIDDEMMTFVDRYPQEDFTLGDVEKCVENFLSQMKIA